MSKTRRVNHLEVVIEVPLVVGRYPPVKRSVDATWREADEIVSAVKRHLTAYHDDARQAFIRVDRDDVCGYCGAAWTEKSDLYNGGCCQKDQEEEESREQAEG